MVRKGGSQEGGYLEDTEGSLTGDMEDLVITDVMNDVFTPWKIPLKFCVDIFIGSVSGRTRRGVLGGH